MKLLLDTHVFLWWLAGDRRLSAPARTAMAGLENSVLVSAASIWEIAIKASVGKLRLPGGADVALDGLVSACGFSDLPVTARHAAAVRVLPFHHSDPFDRLLVAQAMTEKVTLATADAAFAPYGIPLLKI